MCFVRQDSPGHPPGGLTASNVLQDSSVRGWARPTALGVHRAGSQTRVGPDHAGTVRPALSPRWTGIFDVRSVALARTPPRRDWPIRATVSLVSRDDFPQASARRLSRSARHVLWDSRPHPAAPAASPVPLTSFPIRCTGRAQAVQSTAFPRQTPVQSKDADVALDTLWGTTPRLSVGRRVTRPG